MAKFIDLLPELVDLICTNLEDMDASNFMLSSKNNLRYLRSQMNKRFKNRSKIMEHMYKNIYINFKKGKTIEIIKQLQPSCISSKLIRDLNLESVEISFVVQRINNIYNNMVKHIDGFPKNKVKFKNETGFLMMDGPKENDIINVFMFNNLHKWIKLLKNNDKFYYDIWPDFNNLWE